jgi:hypothetical protein
MKSCVDCHKTKSVERFKKGRNICKLCWRVRHRDYMRSAAQKIKNRVRNYGWKARYVRCKRSAELRRIPFELTREQYQAICDLPCTYCGYETKDTGHGLDRKDSKTGYVLENVVPACAMCNWAKNACFTYEEAFELGKAIRLIRQQRAQG